MYGYDSYSRIKLSELKPIRPIGKFKNILLFSPHKTERQAIAQFQLALMDALKAEKANVQSLKFKKKGYERALEKLGGNQNDYAMSFACARDCINRAEIITSYLEKNENPIVLELHSSKAFSSDYELEECSGWQRVGKTNLIINSFARTIQDTLNYLYFWDIGAGKIFDEMAWKIGMSNAKSIFNRLYSYQGSKIIAKENRAFVLELPGDETVQPGAEATYGPLVKKGAALEFGTIKYTFQEAVDAVAALLTRTE